jgi:hypothetical protein
MLGRLPGNMCRMAQLVATALAMVNAPSDEVHAALSDYTDVRRNLLTEEFGDYEVLTGGQGVGTEVRWTMALDEAIRNRKGKAPKKQQRPLWECVIQVVESGAGQIIERDTMSTLVTTWTLQAAEDSRTAVRVNATWEHPGGLFTRQSEQLALRTLYEGLLTKLHDYFEHVEAGQDDEHAGEEAAIEADAQAKAVEPRGVEPEHIAPNSTETDSVASDSDAGPKR